jgi:hypothetical protein
VTGCGESSSSAPAKAADDPEGASPKAAASVKKKGHLPPKGP